VRLLAKLAAVLRVGLAAAVAYRGEFFVWILTTNMPLVMMALWTRVAAEGPVGRFTQRGFVAYYLGVLVVRFLCGSWVVWEMTFAIRDGSLRARLLRPIHPFVHYAADNLAQMPLRLVVVAPIAAGLVAVAGRAGLSHDPLQWAMVPVALAGAWALTYCAMLAVATLALYLESALTLWDLWMVVGYVLAGYLVPQELLPAALRSAAYWLPWRYTLALPLESMLGLIGRAETLRGLGLQWAWTAGFLLVALSLWRRGLRRYEAFGG
jgi:ABC-2 type transport system permease protein